jgi:predicted hydrolase (HD superfamily)
MTRAGTSKNKRNDEIIQRLQEILELISVGTNEEKPAKHILNIDEAAKYTGRSRRTFQKECKEGIWTSIRIKGSSHPRFLAKDLDEDMESWKQIGRYRKHTSCSRASKVKRK